MSALRNSSVMLGCLFISGCSPGSSDPPPPPPKTVFDPLTQQLDHARDVQKTVDANSDSTRAAVDAEERGDSKP